MTIEDALDPIVTNIAKDIAKKWAQGDLVEVVRCKDCKHWNDKKRVCECPEWTDMDGWHKATDAGGYCFRADRKEKTDE